ncbi:MAG: hypothetical protein VKJ02_18215 [Snowella sp.]|nr:hypothetical protein [Snowella sp.]
MAAIIIAHCLSSRSHGDRLSVLDQSKVIKPETYEEVAVQSNFKQD